MSPHVSIRFLAAQSDGRLVDLVGRGNERAFEALVSRYRAPLLRYCSRMGLSEALAEDVVQHSLLKAWQALIDGTTVRELRPWLYRIVHNLAISSIRSTREEPGELPETGEHGILGATPAGPEDRLAAREALGHVAALPDMQRNAIVLTAIEGRSHEEAASVLGITDGAVRGLIHRARTSMRAAAAAFMPPGLQAWLSRGSDAVPLSERSGELTAGAGILGLTGVLTKGALVAATAGILVAGGSAVRGGHHTSPHRQAPSQAVRPAGAAALLSDSPTATSRPTAGEDRGRHPGARHRSGSDRNGEHAATSDGSGQADVRESGESSQSSGETRPAAGRDGSGSSSEETTDRNRGRGGSSTGTSDGSLAATPDNSGSDDLAASEGGTGGDTGGGGPSGTSNGQTTQSGSGDDAPGTKEAASGTDAQDSSHRGSGQSGKGS